VFNFSRKLAKCVPERLHDFTFSQETALKIILRRMNGRTILIKCILMESLKDELKHGKFLGRK
jgi:hypothetical protein